VSAPDPGSRLEGLLAELEETLAAIEKADESEDAVELLATMAELAREVQAEIDRLRRDAPDAPA
jgi:putative NADPH-quinone reductase